jgi:prepilin-type N-terminal cleavage/methylation domain-containing protein
MNASRYRGFTLVELAITLTVIGLVLAFSVPAFKNFSGSQNLHGAAENIGAQLRLSREKAVTTGLVQPMHFVSPNVYHIHPNGGSIVLGAQWTLPNGITFGRAMGDFYNFQPDGRVQLQGGADGVIPLVDSRGNRDTVTVQSSGTIFIQ